MARTEEMPKRMPTPQLPQPGDDRAQQVDPQSMPGLPAPPDERSGGGDVGQKLDALTQEVRRLAAALEGRQTPDAGTPDLPQPGDDRAQQIDPQSMPGLPAPPDERSGGGDVGQKLDALTQEVRRLAAALEGRQTPDAGTPDLPQPKDDRKATGAPKEVRTDDMSARQMLSLILSRVAQIADQRPQGML